MAVSPVASPLDPNLAAILTHLTRREAGLKAKIVTLSFFGLITLLFGPLVISCIYWVIPLLWNIYVPWTWIFWSSCLILIPLLFCAERRTGSSYYDDAVLASFTGPPMPMSGFLDVDALVNVVQNSRAGAIGIVELSLWGPRQILDAIGKIRGMRRLACVDKLRVAQLLATIRSTDHAEVEDLLSSDKDMQSILAALAYLIWYDWVGVSANGKRVWLNSDSRRLLDS